MDILNFWKNSGPYREYYFASSKTCTKAWIMSLVIHDNGRVFYYTFSTKIFVGTPFNNLKFATNMVISIFVNDICLQNNYRINSRMINIQNPREYPRNNCGFKPNQKVNIQNYQKYPRCNNNVFTPNQKVNIQNSPGCPRNNNVFTPNQKVNSQNYQEYPRNNNNNFKPNQKVNSQNCYKCPREQLRRDKFGTKIPPEFSPSWIPLYLPSREEEEEDYGLDDVRIQKRDSYEKDLFLKELDKELENYYINSMINNY